MSPETAVMEAPATPVETGAGGGERSFDDVLNETASLMTGEVAEEAPPGEAPAPAEPAAPAPSEIPPGEAPTTEAEYKLTPDGQSYLVPKDQLANIKALREYSTKVQEKFPTIQDAEAAHTAATNMRGISSDYLHGTDADIQSVLEFFAGADVLPGYPDLKAQHEQSFFRMADQMPTVLEKLSPERYETFSNNLVGKEISRAYDAAAKSGNPADLKYAQRLDWGWTGQYRADAKAQPATQQQAPDAAFAAREQELAKRESAITESQWKGFNDNTVEGPKWSAFYKYLDDTLAPVKDSYDATVWPHVREGIAKDTIKKIAEDSNWAREHSNTLRGLKSTFEHLTKTGKQPNDLKASAQAWQSDFMMRVRRHLPSIAQPLLAKAPAAKPAPQTSATSPKTAQPQAKTAPPSTPPRAPNGQFKSLAEKEAREKQLLDETAALMGF